MDKTHILIVDDDPGLLELLEEYLSGNGYSVSCAANGMELEQRLAEKNADLLLLDLMLPGEDGLSLARKLRAGGARLPIIMLSARGEDIDRIVGLEVGADDYLAKPFNPRELLARIRAVLRRTGEDQATTTEAPAAAGSGFGPFHLDIDSRRLTRENREIPLTSGDFNLLRLFVEHPNRVLSRDMLMEWIKGYDRDPFDRSIDVRVTRLRRKIEADPAAPVYIRTVRGEGYMFTPRGSD
ncbi:MAG: response regulator [Sulfuricellaceae bacterium]|nr:response regulator [Sulfuricellaceae bacterium]